MESNYEISEVIEVIENGVDFVADATEDFLNKEGVEAAIDGNFGEALKCSDLGEEGAEIAKEVLSDFFDIDLNTTGAKIAKWGASGTAATLVSPEPLTTGVGVLVTAFGIGLAKMGI